MQSESARPAATSWSGHDWAERNPDRQAKKFARGFNVRPAGDVFVRVRAQRLVICAAAALPLSACGSGDSSGSTATTPITPSTGSGDSGSTVVVQNYAFPAISAAPGATLQLVDRDDEPHTVTADDGSFKAGPFNPKTPGSLVTPSKPGSYAFHCEIHPTMHGTLVVRNP